MNDSSTSRVGGSERARTAPPTRETEGPRPDTGEAASRRLDSGGASSGRSSPTTPTDHAKDVDFNQDGDGSWHHRLSWLGGEEHASAQADSRGTAPDAKAAAAADSGGGATGTEPRTRTPGEVAQVLKDNLKRLDTAAGGGIVDKVGSWLGLGTDGVFGIADLQKVASDPGAPQDLREAAQQVIDDPNLYHSLDAAAGGNLDDRMSAQDLDRVIKSQAASSNKASILDMAKRLNATEAGQPKSNFDIYDAANNGKNDGKISREDLQSAANNQSLTPAQRQLAQQFLDDPTYWDAFDMGARKGGKDGLVSREDLNNVLYAPDPRGSRDEWSADKAAALDRALHDPNLSASDLFKGFSQTDRGNCVSTAIIKGAIDHYGSKIFDSVTSNSDGGYTVRLQDGAEVTVSQDELSQAAAGAHYNANNDETGSLANLAYAVMAKQAQQYRHEGSRDYAEALVSLANGENPEQTPAFLGLEHKMQKVDVKDVQGMNGVVAWGHGHCIYVDTLSGQTFGDAWGTQKPYDGTNYTADPNSPDYKRDDHTLTDAYIFR